MGCALLKCVCCVPKKDVVTPYLPSSQRCPITMDKGDFYFGTQPYDVFALRQYLLSTGKRCFPHDGSEVTEEDLRVIDLMCKASNGNSVQDFFASGKDGAVRRRIVEESNEEKLDDMIENDIVDAVEANNVDVALSHISDLAERSPRRAIEIQKKLQKKLRV